MYTYLAFVCFICVSVTDMGGVGSFISLLPSSHLLSRAFIDRSLSPLYIYPTSPLDPNRGLFIKRSIMHLCVCVVVDRCHG